MKQLEIDNQEKDEKIIIHINIILIIRMFQRRRGSFRTSFEISLDGQSFDPYERYSVINTFGGEKWVDGKLKKIFILYLQIDDGSPRLDRQHFAFTH